MSKPQIGKERGRFESYIETRDQVAIHPIGYKPEIPEAIKGLNWGAFALGPIWGYFMKVHLAWLCLTPWAGVIMQFVLLFKGNQWAWEKGSWDSVEHFQRVQRKWAWATAILFILMFFISLIASTYLSRLIYNL